MLLQKVERTLLRLTPYEEPVSAAGRAFIPEEGWTVPLLRRIGPAQWIPDWLRSERGDITASGGFFITWRDVFDTTQLTIDHDLETHRTAIFSSVITPNFSTDTAYNVAPYNANELSGGSWPAGGVLVTGTLVDESPTGTIRFDATDVSQVTSTFTGGEGSLYYADASAGNEAMWLHDFGTTASPNNGTMTIQWNTLGVGTIDFTPP